MVEADAKSAIDIGSIIDDRYEILAYIGQGGMGVAYKARDRQSDTIVAIKVLSAARVPDAQSVARFEQETRAASRLDHPCLTRVYDFGIAESGQPYLVMELLEGTTLAEKIAEEGQLSVDATLRIFIPVCEGLEHAHSHQIVHRDLKPSNIMLTVFSDSSVSVKILDFGLAKIQTLSDEESLDLTLTGQLVGSPFYMSPEQARGTGVDHRSDLYSLGCSMYEALTGGPPHVGKSTISTLMKRESDPPLPLAEGSLGKRFPEQVEHVVARLLNRVPDERFQTAQEVSEELLRLLKGEPIKSFPPVQAGQSERAAHTGPISSGTKILLLSSFAVLLISGVLVANTITSMKPKPKQKRSDLTFDYDRFKTLPVDLPEILPAIPSEAVSEVEKSRTLRDKKDYKGAEQILLGAIERYRKKFGKESPTEAALVTELGETYIAAEKMDQAYETLKRAYRISWNATPGKILALANASQLLASYYGHRRPGQKQTDTARALELYKQAADIYEKLPKARPFQVGQCFLGAGVILLSKGDYKGAQPLLEKSVNQFGRLHNQPKGLLFNARRNLSECYRHQHKFDKALECDTQTLAFVETNSEESYDAKLLQQCIARNRIGFDNVKIAQRQDESARREPLAAAEENFNRSLQLSENQEQLRTQRMDAFEGLGEVHLALAPENPDNIAKADHCYQIALEMCLNDPEQPGLAGKYEKLGWLNLFAGNIQKQNQYFELAMRSPGSYGKSIISDQLAAATRYGGKKQFDMAKSICTRLLDSSERLYGRNSIEYADVCFSMGKLCQAEKRTREAQNYLHKALAIYQKTLGPGDSRTTRVAKLLGSG